MLLSRSNATIGPTSGASRRLNLPVPAPRSSTRVSRESRILPFAHFHIIPLALAAHGVDALVLGAKAWRRDVARHCDSQSTAAHHLVNDS
eukprot:scaffold7684_cov119-Isochrysis_galbana.AAC.15